MLCSPGLSFYFTVIFPFCFSLVVILKQTEALFLFTFFFFTILQGPTEFTETLNRVAVITLAILVKTRGIADADHLHYLQTMLEQTMATSQHTWSEKTLRFFPTVLREALSGRMDKRSLAIQAWQQVGYSSCLTISTSVLACLLDW